MIRRHVAWPWAALALLFPLVPLTVPLGPAQARGPEASDAASHRSADADELYGRLLAPCCWNQTLDVHESPIATQLRLEIRERVRAGEPAMRIEDDLAARHGERIRAVPRGRDPRNLVPLFIGGAMLTSLLALLWVARRWLRAADKGAARNDDDAPPNVDGYDAALDHELERTP